MANRDDYRIRLVKRDGSKTRPVDVNLKRDWGEFDRHELRGYLLGLIREHTSDGERHIRHYGLEVLHHRTDEVKHLYRTED